MLKQFEVIQTPYGPALTIVDTSRYDGFLGFRRIVKYLSDIAPRAVCVMRDFQGHAVPLKIEPQKNYREWVGCFSVIEVAQ